MVWHSECQFWKPYQRIRAVGPGELETNTFKLTTRRFVTYYDSITICGEWVPVGPSPIGRFDYDKNSRVLSSEVRRYPNNMNTSKMSTRRVLVTGATGKQGGAVIKALQSSESLELLALTRNSNSPSAKKLESQGVRLIQGDQKFPENIFATAGEVDTVFLVTTSEGITPEVEERQGKIMFDAAQTAGVKHFVFSSVDRHGFQPTPVRHWVSKHFIEKHIMENAKTTEWTILRPVAFMDNFSRGMMSRILFTCYEAYVGRDKLLQHVAVDDIGRFAAITIQVRSLSSSNSLSNAN